MEIRAMKPFTSDTFGRNHYFYAPKEHKEHKVPKASRDRRGKRSSVRQKIKIMIRRDLP